MSNIRKPLLTGRVLGDRYTLIAPIAQGGMGEVWKARDRVTGRLVATKILKSDLRGQELSLSRLRLEASNAMRINHPNVANVLDSGEEDGIGWIVMELVDSRPLTDYLAQGSRISPTDIMPLILQVAMALDAAQKAGVTHRDIKPANILIRPDGVAKITDFGISRTSDQVTLTAEGMVMGTAQYLPPEQAMGQPATSQGDLYALGVIFYEALAGKRPYTGKSQVDIAFAHVNESLPPLPEDIPAPVAHIAYALLEKDPARRPQTGTQLARMLVSAATDLGISLQPHPLTSTAIETDTPQTMAQPIVPPVKHERTSHLPPEMLAPPTAETFGNDPILPAWPDGSVSSFPPVPSPRGSEQRSQVAPRGHNLPRRSASTKTPSLATKYNRSQVAPNGETGINWGQYIVIGLFVVTLFLIVIASIRNRLGQLPATSDSIVATIEEVQTWLNPLLVV